MSEREILGKAAQKVSEMRAKNAFGHLQVPRERKVSQQSFNVNEGRSA